MAAETQTRERFIQAAADLFREQGYHRTGINEIARRGGAPIGSLYHHFPEGKEQLAVAALLAAGATTSAEMRTVLAESTDAQSALASFITLLKFQLTESSFRRGCPIATVALEAAAENPRIQQACSEVYTSWISLLRAALIGFGFGADKAERLSEILLCSVEGALVLTRAHKNPHYMDLIGENLREQFQGQIDDK